MIGFDWDVEGREDAPSPPVAADTEKRQEEYASPKDGAEVAHTVHLLNL